VPHGVVNVQAVDGGLDLNGEVTGLEAINVTKGFEVESNVTSSGLTGFNVRAEVALPQISFDFDLQKVSKAEILLYLILDVIFELFWLPTSGTATSRMLRL
jgi:hypothetical protein